MVKTATNQNGKSQNGDMPTQRRTVNGVTVLLAEYCIVNIPHYTTI